jgi:hypothetical protein
MTIIRPGDKKLHRWIVYSPIYGWGGGYYEPPDYGADTVEVDAFTKPEAIALGVKEMLKKHMGWVMDNRADGSPPWKGIMAEILACVHGTEYEGCPACDYEWAAQVRSGFIDEW